MTGATARERIALVLIDLQVDFGAADGAMARRGADITAAQAAVTRAQALAEAARGARVPVVFVRLQGNQDLCAEGTHGADFIGPQPMADEMVISKTRFSAFARTGLAEQLRAAGIDTLVLAGLTTECCVAASAWAAFEQDFQVFIAADACAAYEEALHRQTLRALELSGATVTSTEEIAASWK
ncbi:MAG TPA: cysteine hydrolase [Rhizomicrobium sp.]